MTEKNFSLVGRTLMIAIPAYDGKLNIQSAYQLPQLALDSTKYMFNLKLAQLTGCSIVSAARNTLVNQFLESDATELLFIDADVNFTAADVLRIMALGSDKDVVCGAYPRRAGSSVYFADVWYDDENNMELTDGLLRVKRSGTGFMFIRRHVIETLVAANPEWKYHVEKEGKDYSAVFDFKVTPGGYIGEDYVFCDRATDAGFKIYIDPDINLGHYGQTEYTGHFGEQVLKPMMGA